MSNPVPIPQELLDFINKGDKFLVVGHKEPDGDCVGSQLALTSVLRRLGKEAIPCSAGPFKRTEIMPYQDRFISALSEKEREGARVLVMDCSAPHRTGDLAPALDGLPCAIIDHHATGQYADDRVEGPLFLDPNAPSVTFMTLGLIEALGLKPTPEEAEFLFFGLCTDTGFFRHVDAGGAETFAYASRMIRAGANPKEVFQAINGGKSLSSRILMGILLSRTQGYFGGKLMLTTEGYEDTQRFGLEGRDSDSLYQLLQSIAGVEAIVIIRQETPQNCTAGLRSRDTVDVAKIAAEFGGGGHRNAAGLSVTGTIEAIRPRILKAFEKVFPEEPLSNVP
ncbi:MAG: bifunctional oligoribonuclease/PAP phosphatase NrnA [Treponema sp.]|jgi:phosphoesterase RecJ-like protein|nr:bifunctional oligoribonuclease/PAP phosphatase NrnA [Treponema sp.]